MRLVWFRGKWHAYERVGGQPRRYSLGTADRQVAQRRLADLELQQKVKPTTVVDMYQIYLEERGPHIASQETLRLAWMRLNPVFGHLRPDQVDRARTRAYTVREQRRGVGNASIRRDLGVLKAILRWNDKATPATVEMPPAPAAKTEYLTRVEYERLRDAAASAHVRLFIILGHSTAGRHRAILQLTWRRIDFERGLIDLREGTGSARAKGRAVVPMTEAARSALFEAREAAITDHVIEYAGKPVGSVKKAFARAAGRAGVPWATPHTLRHTAAVHMAERGVSMDEIAQYLGHTDSRVTYRVYARFSPQYLRKAASALDAAG